MGFHLAVGGPPPPACPIQGLLLDEAAISTYGWHQPAPPSARGAPSSAGIERIGTYFEGPDLEGAISRVYRFYDDSYAERAYWWFSMDWFETEANETLWLVPSELTSRLTADQWRTGCNQVESPIHLHQCRLIARYGVYVAELSVATKAPLYSDFDGLLAEIDVRFRTCMAPQP